MVQPFEAIASLDLCDYGRLTEQDEVGTHRALMACWKDHLQPIVADRRGSIVKSTGDGALLRFPTAAAAVRAMVRFQQAVAAAEAGFPSSRRLVFRVGIHLAAAIEENGDVFGHGVNLAVRLQEAAEPGSVLMSDAVRRHLDAELDLSVEPLGRRWLKNVSEPLRVHGWPRGHAFPSRRRRPVTALAAAVLLVALVMPSAISNEVGIERRSIPLAFAASRTSDRPPETAIRSRHGLPVRPLDAAVPTALSAQQQSIRSREQIAEDAYLQALALFGRHTPETFAWAIAELERSLEFQPENAAAHALLAAVYWRSLENRWQLGSGLTWADMLARAKRHLAEVAAPDPFAHMVKAEMMTASGRHGPAIEEARKAITLAPDRAVGHHALGRALLFAGHADDALAPIRTAIRLDPQAPRYLFGLGLAQFSLNRFDEAGRSFARATLQNDEDDWPHLLTAATSGFLGETEAAGQALGRFDRLSVPRRGWFASQIPYVHAWPFRDREDRDRLHRGMVLAGVPEASAMAGAWASAR